MVLADVELAAQVGPAGAQAQPGEQDDPEGDQPQRVGTADRPGGGRLGGSHGGGRPGRRQRRAVRVRRGLDRRPGEDRRGVGLPLEVHHVGDDDADVVRPTAAQGQRDQEVDRLLRRSGAQCLRQDVQGGHGSGQPVAAQQVPVPDLDLVNRQVQLDDFPAVQRAGHQGALRVDGGLLPGDPSFVDQGLHQGVVTGDLVELAAAQAIGPGVADVQQGQPVTCRQHGGQGGPHPLQRGVTSH